MELVFTLIGADFFSCWGGDGGKELRLAGRESLLSSVMCGSSISLLRLRGDVVVLLRFLVMLGDSAEDLAFSLICGIFRRGILSWFNMFGNDPPLGRVSSLIGSKVTFKRQN